MLKFRTCKSFTFESVHNYYYAPFLSILQKHIPSFGVVMLVVENAF